MVKKHVQLLESLLEEKKTRVHSYSLRALARDLNVSQPLLTKILRGERKLSPRLALKIGRKLGLDKDKLYELLLSTIE
jgi:plasmid maintenance system antidote protein VapI